MDKMINTQELLDVLLKKLANQKQTIEDLNYLMKGNFKEKKNDDITITLPIHTARELAKFVDCYAPLLREVARACEESLNGKG